MKPVLYIFIGYPGSGKTSAALEIAKLTGAVHLWADKIRREDIGKPSYSHEENTKLYEAMNNNAAKFLASGESVIFDTAFNFYSDRQRLRKIAEENGAMCIILWLKTDRELAKERALSTQEQEIRPVGHHMKPGDFERMADSLEEPHTDETFIELDGTKISAEYIADKLHLNEVN